MQDEEGQTDPYLWDDTCETINEALEEEGDSSSDEEEEEVTWNLKKTQSTPKASKQAMAVRKAKAMTLAKQAAAAQNSSNDNFGAGIAAGAGVGAVGVLAAFIALRACQRKRNDGDNFERLLE